MRITTLFCLFAALLIFCPGTPMARQQEAAGSGMDNSPSADRLLKRLEERYSGRNFSVDFRQESTLEAMDIKDEALGKAWFKHPGKMRWEYREPEKHVIVTDGETLWIYRPEDRQVVVGDAANYFGNGKGASFLAEFELLKEIFEVSLENCGSERCRMKLVPREKQQELAAVYIEINRDTMDIKQVDSENIYGDITRIFFKNQEFDPDMKNGLFEFSIPSGSDVLRMEE
ncbi:MAG: outer membrane lipoprotein carrier protein LolA [Desulfobacteraceae bacterium]|nr:outer membrane lipoprotein carrier protein LolA [Desulfobacteraceae bacterium]